MFSMWARGEGADDNDDIEIDNEKRVMETVPPALGSLLR
jgi:hypothetical protein